MITNQIEKIENIKEAQQNINKSGIENANNKEEKIVTNEKKENKEYR